jgi:DNA polymerase-3 subunit epsilon
MLILVYDTETTGLPDYHQPSEAPQQPHIVELAAILYDTHLRQVVDEIDVLIRPDGWIIPDDAIAIHGISNELAQENGIGESEAIGQFMAMHSIASFRVGHNESFDQRIIRIGIKRFIQDDAIADAFKASPALCTMWTATKHTKLKATQAMRAAGRFYHKNPNLSEAHKHFCGTPHDGAHRAMADAQATLRVLVAMMDAGIDCTPRAKPVKA